MRNSNLAAPFHMVATKITMAFEKVSSEEALDSKRVYEVIEDDYRKTIAAQRNSDSSEIFDNILIACHRIVDENEKKARKTFSSPEDAHAQRGLGLNCALGLYRRIIFGWASALSEMGGVPVEEVSVRMIEALNDNLESDISNEFSGGFKMFTASFLEAIMRNS